MDCGLAALRPYAATDYDELYAEIAEHTGYPMDEVEEIIGDFLADQTLSDKYVMMLDPPTQIEGPNKLVKEWFEKGPMWGKPRMTLRR